MPTHVRATLVLDTGKSVEMSDIDALADGLVDLLDRLFPGHSGSCITACPVDENGDPIKK